MPAIAFSTSRQTRTVAGTPDLHSGTLLSPEAMSPLFQAALEATEEAVYNSLLQATRVTGQQYTAEPIPIDRVREILGRYRPSPE